MFKFLLVTAVLATIAFFIWRHNQHIDAEVSQNKAMPQVKRKVAKVVVPVGKAISTSGGAIGAVAEAGVWLWNKI